MTADAERTLGKDYQQQFRAIGVYAEVRTGGTVRRGDPPLTLARYFHDVTHSC
jgi:hypothetical protein